MKKICLITTVMLAVLLSAAQAKEESPELLFQKALYLETSKADYAGAITVYEEILKTQEQNAEWGAKALYHMGLCLVKIGSQDVAGECAIKLARDYVLIVKQNKEMESFVRKYKSSASDEQNLRRKLEAIIIPELNFREALLTDACQALQKLSVSLDTNSPPGERGVNIVLSLTKPMNEAAGQKLVIPLITLSFKSISLLDAIKFVSEVAGLRYRIKSNMVVICRPDSPELLITRTYKLPPSAAEAAIDPATGTIDFTKLFVNAGVPFGFGAVCQYDKKTKILMVTNSEDKYELIEMILKTLSGGDLKSPVQSNATDEEAAEILKKRGKTSPGGSSPLFTTLKECPERQRMETEIKRALAFTNDWPSLVSDVAIGRLALEGKGDVQKDVKTQMEIWKGGYFVALVGTKDQPLSFRAHGYMPLDVALENIGGHPLDIGTVRMRALNAAQQASLKGIIKLEGGGDPSKVLVTADIVQMQNTPGNHAGDSYGMYENKNYHGAPVPVAVAPNGQFHAKGFSPAEYEIAVVAKGYVTRHIPAQFCAGKVLDIGIVELEKPKTLNVTYTGSGLEGKRLNATLSPGEQWVPSLEGDWGLFLAQEGGKLRMDSSYGPWYCADLGAGKLDDYKGIDPTARSLKQDPPLEIKSGRVYLIQMYKGQWLLFEANIK